MDLNTNAFRIVGSLTKENKEDSKVSSAREAGKKGGNARSAVLTPERRRQIARKAIAVRWGKSTTDGI